MMKMPKKQ